MSKRPSARELVNTHLGKKISPQGQAVIDSFKHLRDPGEEAQEAKEPEEAKHDEDSAVPTADNPTPSPNVIHSAPAEGSHAAVRQLHQRPETREGTARIRNFLRIDKGWTA